MKTKKSKRVMAVVMAVLLTVGIMAAFVTLPGVKDSLSGLLPDEVNSIDCRGNNI